MKYKGSGEGWGILSHSAALDSHLILKARPLCLRYSVAYIWASNQIPGWYLQFGHNHLFPNSSTSYLIITSPCTLHCYIYTNMVHQILFKSRRIWCFSAVILYCIDCYFRKCKISTSIFLRFVFNLFYYSITILCEYSRWSDETGPYWSLRETHWRPFFSTNDDNLVVILLNKLDLLFQSLIDRNNRLGRLLSHRTFNVFQQSTIRSLTIKVSYVTLQYVRNWNGW